MSEGIGKSVFKCNRTQCDDVKVVWSRPPYSHLYAPDTVIILYDPPNNPLR